ncbi:uncharacterized protein LOC115548682 [Gadus morhua]|uniref:uncharacterized protein LOC115548682 n=1 Tax=Gadus morhua TaxID=8049 RepID=UPI0011B3B6BA|nr:uncharacterized protein LOC115548682 [Gadus morhua]
MTEGDASHTLDEASCSSAQGSLQGAADTSMAAVLRKALARLQLDAAQTESAQASAFFRRNPVPATFSVPPSEEYLKELHACWRDTRALSHSTSDARTLAAMQNAAQVGLGRMPAVEPAIASLILAPDEALRPNARCPRPQCRVTDDLLSKAYDAAARMGRIGNSLSHLLLGLSTSLQQAQVEPPLQSLSDASLEAFALMSRELGRTMSTLVQTRRQVWLAQSPLTETYPWVVSTLTQGYELQFRRRPLAFSRVKMTVVNDPAEALALDQELSTLLAKGAIEPVDPLLHPRGFYSRYFLVKKKDGRFRPILDLRGLIRFLKVLPFHMLTASDTLRVVARGEWFTTLDLRDAYFHVPIAPRHQHFLRFAFRGRHFQFRVLPFGLSLSPRVFTRVVAAALAPLQKQGTKVLPYLDDWLICAPSQSQAARDTARLLLHVARLGLTVNFVKSRLDPSQRVAYLGMVLDSDAVRAYLSPQRVTDILLCLPRFGYGRMVPFIFCLQLLGKLTAASAVVPLGLLSLRPMQMWLNSLHLDPKWHRHRKVRVSRQCLFSLSPWRKRLYMSVGVPMGTIPSRRELVTTDACLSGWGAVWQGRTAQGQWPAQNHAHINVLELRAVQLALNHFLPHLRGKHVLVRSDKMSAVAQINHQGGTRSSRLLRVSRNLLAWAYPRLASVRAVFIPGQRNQVADFLTRQKPPPGEWRLHPEVVETLWGLFGRAEVDLFASEESAHCPLWFSWTEVTGPLGQDALAHDWPQSPLYAFPPQPLILPTLQRVFLQGHRLLLVAPYWPGRLWFPLLRRLCCSSPWRLPCRKDLLSQLGGQIWHPDPRRLQLWAWPLQGPTHC